MNVLIATAWASLPEFMGGMQSTIDALAPSLKERGHEVSLLCGLGGHRPTIRQALLGFGKPGIRARLSIRLFGRKAARDTSLGYPTWRGRVAWEAIEPVVAKVKPDVIVLMCGQQVRMALAARPTGVPLLVALQNVELQELGGSLSDLGNIPCLANSQFTADRYRQAFGVESKVIYPLIDVKKYRTETIRENVTFINPVYVKGVDVALEVARHCPEIPFSFVPSWPLGAAEYRALADQLAALRNVRLHPRTRDMRQVYGRCRILIAPSVWEEAYGRVVSEAQCSGIPAVASNRGGLPEAVGPGGVLLDPHGPLSDWVEAVKRLWYDKAYYSDLSGAAYSHSTRPSLNKAYQLDLWEGALNDAIEHGKRPQGP